MYICKYVNMYICILFGMIHSSWGMCVCEANIPIYLFIFIFLCRRPVGLGIEEARPDQHLQTELRYSRTNDNNDE